MTFDSKSILTWFKWFGSLLGSGWWIAGLFLLGSLITGLSGFTFVLVLGLASAILLAVTKPDTFKFAYNYIIAGTKDWWTSRPRR